MTAPVNGLERRIDRIERRLDGVERLLAETDKPRCSFGLPCAEHDGAVHGAEAEELRDGIERLLKKTGECVSRRELIELLDGTVARDSLAYLEARDRGAPIEAKLMGHAVPPQACRALFKDGAVTRLCTMPNVQPHEHSGPIMSAVPSSHNAPEPAPIATSHRPTWERVIEYVESRRFDSAYGVTGELDLAITDMRERDQVGRQKYGVPLTPGNGRDHLVDAYQEAQDLAVYLANELAERGAQLDETGNMETRPLLAMFRDTVRNVITLRAIIEDKEKR